jgi:hypothetical protein
MSIFRHSLSLLVEYSLRRSKESAISWRLSLRCLRVDSPKCYPSASDFREITPLHAMGMLSSTLLAHILLVLTQRVFDSPYKESTMSQLVEALLEEARFGRMLSDSSVARFSPAEMREAIQELVSQDRLDMANALVDAGLAIHPESEDVLAIAALVSMVRQDWVQAIELLTKLMLVQDGNVQPFTHLMLVRALRSNLEPAAALAATVTGLIQYPDHPELVAEQKALFELAGLSHDGVAID